MTTRPAGRADRSASGPRRGLAHRLTNAPWFPVACGCVLLFACLAFYQPSFLRANNIVNILTQCSLYAIMAVGMVFVISAGGIDISVAMVAFFIMAMMHALGQFLPAGLVLFLALVIGGLAGACNGFLVSVLRIEPIIATLATMAIARGLAYVLIDSTNKVLSDPLQVIGATKVGVIPLPAIIMVAVALIGSYVLNYTRLGRWAIAIGDNPLSARLSGIPVWRVRFWTYVIAGLTVGVAATIYAGRVGSVQPDSMLGYEFTVITAVVLGGTRLTGGHSTVFGAVLGCVFLYLVENALTMLEISSFYQDLARGVIMFLAIGISTISAVRQRSAAREEDRRRIRLT